MCPHLRGGCPCTFLWNVVIDGHGIGCIQLKRPLQRGLCISLLKGRNQAHLLQLHCEDQRNVSKCLRVLHSSQPPYHFTLLLLCNHQQSLCNHPDWAIQLMLMCWGWLARLTYSLAPQTQDSSSASVQTTEICFSPLCP